MDIYHRYRIPSTQATSSLSSCPHIAQLSATVFEIDTSDHDIGAILQQQGHPIAFMSKALIPCYQGLSTYDMEYLAIIVAVDQRRPYLQHAEFDIITDQKSLVYLEEKRLTTPWQQKAFTKLLGLRYHIRYKKGIKNVGADTLSRANPTDTLVAITSCLPTWLDDVINSYNNNPRPCDFWNNLLSRRTQRSDSLFNWASLVSAAEHGWGEHTNSAKDHHSFP